MGFLRTLSQTLPLPTIRSHAVFSVKQCRLHPLTEELAAPMAERLVQYITISQMEMACNDAVDEAYANVHKADRGLNEFASMVSRAVLLITGDDRTHMLYTLFFGKKTLCDFKRPMLGSQLASMRGWSSVLAGSRHAPLKALAPELPPLLAAADAAVAARAAAEKQKKAFREDGERCLYINDVNASRRSLWTELSNLPHQHPELPASFADGFFRRDLATDGEEEATAESIQQEIEDLTKQIEAKQAQLESFQQQAQQDDALEMALKAKEEMLRAMREETAARLLAEQALQAEIDAARAG